MFVVHNTEKCLKAGYGYWWILTHRPHSKLPVAPVTMGVTSVFSPLYSVVSQELLAFLTMALPDGPALSLTDSEVFLRLDYCILGLFSFCTRQFVPFPVLDFILHLGQGVLHKNCHFFPLSARECLLMSYYLNILFFIKAHSLILGSFDDG